MDEFKELFIKIVLLNFVSSNPSTNQTLYDLKIIEEDFLDFTNSNFIESIGANRYINTSDFTPLFEGDEADRYYMIKKLFNVKISQIFKKQLDLKKKFIDSKVFISNSENNLYFAFSDNQLLNKNLKIRDFSETIENLIENENITDTKINNIISDFKRTKFAKLTKDFRNGPNKTYINYFYNIFINDEKKKQREFADISKFYNINPGSLSGTGNIYGFLDYDNFVLNNENVSVEDSMEDNIVQPRKKVFFQMYFRTKDNESGPIDLYERTFLESTLVPEIKYTNDKGLLTWFMNNTFQKKKPDGKFKNKEEWEDIFKTIKSEGFYNINPNGAQMVRDKLKPIKENLKTLFISLQNNPNTEQLKGDVKNSLKEILTKFKFNEKCEIMTLILNLNWKPLKKDMIIMLS